MGIPVVRTGKLVANQNSSGIYDPGSPNDGKSSIMLVHRPSFLRGDRRRITVKTKEDIETDQMIVVSNMRKAFRTVRADGQTYGCLGINIS